MPARVGSLGSGDLFEREQELAVVDGLLDAARGGAGGLVLITGPAGIGKTSLLDACHEAGEKRGIVVLRAIADELLMGSSFATVRELLWPRVQAAGQGVWEGAAGLAAPVFRTEGAEIAERPPAASVLHGLYWLVAGLAEHAPLALLVDDGQWLDHASAGFFAYLARRVGPLPVLLVVAMRGGETLGAPPALGPLVELGGRELRISPLSEDASVALVRRRLGARADSELCRSCWEATGGNPFYLRELTVALEAERERPSVELAKSVRELGAGAIGRTVLVRLARLGSDCERLAQAVAVLGPGCALRHAAALARLERDQAEAAADALRAADLLTGGRALSFSHPIVAEALTAELPPSRLAAMHGRAADLLVADGAGPERVSLHLLSTEPYGEPARVDVLRSAAREALARGAPELAVSYLRRALAEPPPKESRLGVLRELGRAECLAPIATDFTALREALALADDPRQRVDISLELALGLFAVIRNQDGRAVLEEALEREEDLDADTVEQLEAALIAGGLDELAATPMLLVRAERHFEAARRGAVRDPRTLAALAVTGVVTGMSAQDAGALAELALRDERMLSRWLDDGYVTATAALCMADRLADADHAADAGIVEAQHRGLASMFMQLAVVRAETAFRAGDLDLAHAYAERALELGRELGAEHVALRQWLPIVLLERGDVNAALRLLEPAELDRAALAGSFAVVVLAHRGRALVAAGDLDRGLADLLDADRRMVAAGWQLSVLTDWVPSAAVALLELGRAGEARQLATRELADAVAFGAARRHGIALSLAGRLEGGDEGLALLRRAVGVLERTPARLEHARALINLGEGLRTRGHRVEARSALTQAISIAGELGAGALSERARLELVATGARPRRTALSGPDALTPAERRTARMAAGGLSNREIAQALFVSAKTVEAQLSQAYAKLAIHSRQELHAALTRGRPDSGPVKQ